MENRLEQEVRMLTEQKDQLRSALHKWSNARFLLVYAYNQLQCSESKWIEMMKLDIKYKIKFILEITALAHCVKHWFISLEKKCEPFAFISSNLWENLVFQ